MTSDSFFAPWSLVYSDRLALDGADARPEGFWGYQHLIEHAPPGHGHLANELRLGDRLEVGLQLDEGIDRDLEVPCLAERYWATFADVPGRDLARTLRAVRRHACARLPRISGLPLDGQVEREEENVKKCLAYARHQLGL